jgi:Xaa-Pro aminopeptidase
MRERDIQAIVVFGSTTLADPDLTYVVGGQLARGGIYFKRAGNSPLLVVSNLDLGSARKAGGVRRIQTFSQWGMEKLATKYGGRDKALPRLIASVLKKQGVRGKVVLAGRNDLASGIDLVARLKRLGVKVIGEQSPTILEVARETKAVHEMDELRHVGRKTSNVVNAVLDTLRDLRRKRGHLQLGKERATVGSVKRLISIKLAEEGVTAPEGTIFAIGPSGADPHNSGIPGQEIKEGKLIVFDIFPQAESGYWCDLTRTFVVGKANAKSRRLYDAVYEAQNECLDMLRQGTKGEEAMLRACEVIERHGYRTIREIFQGKAKNIPSGFNHSLGHGVGLTIGERPYLGFLSKEPLKKGQVVTVEPGVYIPGYGGVRIEDTVAITSRGVEPLAHVEKELELV